MSANGWAGDNLPAGAAIIEVRVAELRQLFNSIDPSPFGERDLDPRAEEFIVDWSREAPADAALALQVHLDRPAGHPYEAQLLGDAVHGYFRGRADSARRRLRKLFRNGRVSLAIGLSALAFTYALARLAAVRLGDTGGLLREGLLIGGWVAMWRPIEVFLYDWWPIRAEARLFDRLATMPVRIQYATRGAADAWRRDWPTVLSGTRPAP